jgi:hypothetical protein
VAANRKNFHGAAPKPVNDAYLVFIMLIVDIQ